MATICGNTYVMKPSERDPTACMALVELLKVSKSFHLVLCAICEVQLHPLITFRDMCIAYNQDK